MGLVLGLEKKFLGVKELYNNFMWKDAEEKNASLVSRKEEINKAEEAKKAELAEKKLKKKAKADRDYMFFRSMVDEKKIEVPDASEMTEEDKPSFLRKVMNNFIEEDEEPEEVLEEGYSKFWGVDYREYTAKIVEISQLFDEKYSQMKAPTGQSLLARKLDSEKLFILDNDDMLRVNNAIEVKPELPTDNKAYVLLQTSREDFVIEFTSTRSF